MTHVHKGRHDMWWFHPQINNYIYAVHVYHIYSYMYIYVDLLDLKFSRYLNSEIL